LYQIIMKQIVDDEDLDPDDRKTFGKCGKDGQVDVEFTAASEEECLDLFHDEIPIACLENYEIFAHGSMGEAWCETCSMDMEYDDHMNCIACGNNITEEE